MNLQNLFNSTNALLLLAGLTVLLLSLIVSALRLWRGHVRSGFFSVILVIGACALIGAGLVRMTFPALAGNAALTARAAANLDSSGRTAGQNPTIAVQATSATVTNGQSATSGQTGQGSTAGTGANQGGQGRQAGLNNQAGTGANQGGQANQPVFNNQNSQGGSANQIEGPVLATRLATLSEIGAIVILLAGLILYFGERRRQNFESSSSAGLLYAGAGIFILVAALVIPGLPGQFRTASASSDRAANPDPVAFRSVLQTATPTPTPMPWPTPTDIPSLTPAPSESPMPLFTAIAYAGSNDAGITTVCSVTAQTALNLRGDPSTKQQAVGKVFAGSLLSVTGQSADKKWWRVISSDGGTQVEGWVSAEFVNNMPGCANASIPVVGPTPTVTRTPRP